jgi:predicted permease
VPRPVRILLQAVFSLVLLIACANVANLVLARNEGRRTEVAVRLALGAGKLNIARSLLAETLALSLAAAPLGLLCASWCNLLLENIRIPGLPESFGLRLNVDARVALFAAAASVLSALVCGLLPLRAAYRTELTSWLKGKEIRVASCLRLGWRGIFVSVQVALSLVWLTAAAMCVRGLLKEAQADAGFDTRNAVVAGLMPGSGGYNEARSQALLRNLLARLQAEPGVRSVTSAWLAPLALRGWEADVRNTGSRLLPLAASVPVDSNAVGAGYFRTMSIPLLSGREFEAVDLKRNVAVVNETMARRFWPGESPLGRVVTLTGRFAGAYQVIAVARDCKYHQLREAPRPYLYLPQRDASTFRVILRTAGDPRPHLERLRRLIWSLDPDASIRELQTLTENAEDSMLWSRLATKLAFGVAIITVFLTSLGVYSVVSYAVSRRTRDIGIRMALGASQGQVLATVLRHGAVLIGGGFGAGLLLSLAVTAVLAGLVYGVAPLDPAVLGSAALVLALTAGAGIYIPARRAAALDPLTAMREE